MKKFSTHLEKSNRLQRISRSDFSFTWNQLVLLLENFFQLCQKQMILGLKISLAIALIFCFQPSEVMAHNDGLLFLMDSDGDGVDDADEITNGTNPNVADTDGDGVNDDTDIDPLDPCVPAASAACCTYQGRTFTFASAGANADLLYTTEYALTDELGEILQIVSATTITATDLGLHYLYGVNYRTDKPLTNFAASNNIADVTGDCLGISDPFIFQLCNTAPEITNNSSDATASINFNENGTAVDDFDATDADGDTEGGGGLTYALSGDDAGLFTVDANGNLAFATAPNYESPTDNGSDNVYNVTITVTDADGGTDVQALTINIQNVDEFDILSVTDDNPDDNEVSENASNGDLVGITALATDDDGPDTVTYSLTDDANGRFQIHPTTGVITVLDQSQLDAETNSTHNVEVKAISTDGSMASETFMITVIDENEAPSITSNGSGATATLTAAENQTAVTTVTATDPDAGDTQTYSVSGGADETGFTIDPMTGVLVFNTAPDFENPTDAGTNNTYEVEVTVTDAGGLTDVQTISVTVTDEDEDNDGFTGAADPDDADPCVPSNAASPCCQAQAPTISKE